MSNSIPKILVPCVQYRLRRPRGSQSASEWLRHVGEQTHYPQCGYSNTLAVLVRIDDGTMIGGKICVKEMPDFCGGVIIHSGRVNRINFTSSYDRWSSYIATGTAADAAAVPLAHDIWPKPEDMSDGDYLLAVTRRIEQSLARAVCTLVARMRRAFWVFADKDCGSMECITRHLRVAGELDSYRGGGLIGGQSHVAGPKNWTYSSSRLECVAPVTGIIVGDRAVLGLRPNRNSGNECSVTTLWVDLDECSYNSEDYDYEEDDFIPDECPECGVGYGSISGIGGWDWECDECGHAWEESPPERHEHEGARNPTTDRIYLDAVQTEGYFQWLPTGDNWNG